MVTLPLDAMVARVREPRTAECASPATCLALHSMQSAEAYIGVDVCAVSSPASSPPSSSPHSGTGSVRSCVLAKDGHLLGSATLPIQTWRNSKDHRIFEQSTSDIWNAICSTVKHALKDSNLSPSNVKGIAFDATCSLAVTDAHGGPITVTKGADCGSPGDRNVILWADHRAEREADVINRTGSVVLDYVGGTVSVRYLPSLRPLSLETPTHS